MNEKIKQTSTKGWSTLNGEIFIPTVYEVQNKLVPGFYSPRYDPMSGYCFKKLHLNDQYLIELPDTPFEQVIKDIESFWQKEALFKQYNFPYKRGILLHGPAGTGKSCAINALCRRINTMGGMVFEFTRSAIVRECIKLFRNIEPDVPIIVLMEDLDNILEIENISMILNMLDGVEQSFNNIVYLATTNRPEKLQNNIKNRPSRFDRRFEFGYPSPAARKLYLESLFKEKISADDKWITHSEGFSFAHLKEMFISIILLGNSFNDVVKELQVMKECISSEDYDKYDDLEEYDEPPQTYDT